MLFGDRHKKLIIYTKTDVFDCKRLFLSNRKLRIIKIKVNNAKKLKNT